MKKTSTESAPPKSDSHCGLSSDGIIELQLRGYSVAEIAAMCGSSLSAITAFMCERGKSLIIQPDEKVPAPDLTHPDKAVMHYAPLSGNGGSRRIYRVSLPRVLMHVRQIEASTCA